MTIDEVDALLKSKLVESNRPWGTHFVRRMSSDLWLGFGDEGLESISLVRVDGWRIMATRSSPTYDLCTGELFFFVRIRWTNELLDATVYINGREANDADWAGDFLKLPKGKHEIRFEKPGREPVIRNLDLAGDDRGDQQLYLGAPQPDSP